MLATGRKVLLTLAARRHSCRNSRARKSTLFVSAIIVAGSGEVDNKSGADYRGAMRELTDWFKIILVGVLSDREHWAARAGDFGRHLPYGRVRGAYLTRI